MIATAILSTSAGWLVYSSVAVMDVPLAAALGTATLIAFRSAPAARLVRRRDAGFGHPRQRVCARRVIHSGMVIRAPETLGYIGGRRDCRRALVSAVLIPQWLRLLVRIFWRHHVARFVSATSLQHGQPYWYYLPVVLSLLFPWTPLVALLARKKTYDDVRVRFLVVWLVLFPLVFFTVAHNKLRAMCCRCCRLWQLSWPSR